MLLVFGVVGKEASSCCVGIAVCFGAVGVVVWWSVSWSVIRVVAAVSVVAGVVAGVSVVAGGGCRGRLAVVGVVATCR